MRGSRGISLASGLFLLLFSASTSWCLSIVARSPSNNAAFLKDANVTLTAQVTTSGSAVQSVTAAIGKNTVPLAFVSGNRFSATFVPNMLASGNYPVVFRAKDYAGKTAQGVVTIHVGSRPKITSEKPKSAVAPNGILTLRVSAEDDEPGLKVSVAAGAQKIERQSTGKTFSQDLQLNVGAAPQAVVKVTDRRGWQEEFTIGLWGYNSRFMVPLRTFPHEIIQFDGEKVILADSSGNGYIGDLTTGAPSLIYTATEQNGKITEAQFYPDGVVFLTSGGKVFVSKSGQLSLLYEGVASWLYDGKVSGLVVNGFYAAWRGEPYFMRRDSFMDPFEGELHTADLASLKTMPTYVGSWFAVPKSLIWGFEYSFKTDAFSISADGAVFVSYILQGRTNDEGCLFVWKNGQASLISERYNGYDIILGGNNCSIAFRRLNNASLTNARYADIFLDGISVGFVDGIVGDRPLLSGNCFLYDKRVNGVSQVWLRKVDTESEGRQITFGDSDSSGVAVSETGDGFVAGKKLAYFDATGTYPADFLATSLGSPTKSETRGWLTVRGSTVFSIKTDAIKKGDLKPTVKITSPSTLRGSVYTLAARLTDDVRPVRVQYRLRAPGSRAFGRWVSVTLRNKAKTQNWSQRVALNRVGGWHVQVRAVDADNNASDVQMLRVNRIR